MLTYFHHHHLHLKYNHIDSPTKGSNSNSQSLTAAKIFSATDSSGTTRMLTSSRAISGQNLVTRLITLPGQSPMDSIKEWSVSTFKCTKQLLNEKRGIGSVTNDNQLQADFEQLRDNRSKLAQMLRIGQQMTNHYTQLVKTQKQLHSLMNEMSIKCFTKKSISNTSNNHHSSINDHKKSSSKQVVANFSSLSNNLSSTTTTSPTHHRANAPSASNTFDHYEDFLPVFNHLRNPNLSLMDDFKKNAIALNIAIKNGEKLITALNFYCSNLSTLINKTIEDTLATISQYESARLEYDAERNSLNFISPTAQTSINYSSDTLELARMRYEQLKEDVQIKMKFLEENTIKVVHKQLLLFNGAFASYTSGNTAALDSTLKEFSIK